MKKISVSLTDELYERMNKYLNDSYGETRGRISIFIQDAVREKLDRIQLKRDNNSR